MYEKKIIVGGVVLLIVCAFLGVLLRFNGERYRDSQDIVSDLERTNSELNRELRDRQDRIDRITKSISESRERISDIESGLGESEERVGVIEGELGEVGERLDTGIQEIERSFAIAAEIRELVNRISNILEIGESEIP